METRPLLAMIPLLLTSLASILFNILTYIHFDRETKKLAQTSSRIQGESNEILSSQSAKLNLLSREVEFLASALPDLANGADGKGGLSQELADLKQEISDLEKQIQKNKTEQEKATSESQAELSKQQACTKANELSQIPTDMTFRTTGSADSCGISNFSHIPSSTQGALEYLNGYLQNYRETKSIYWHHNPDVCLQDAGSHQPVLEARYEEYLKYKKLCDET